MRAKSGCDGKAAPMMLSFAEKIVSIGTPDRFVVELAAANETQRALIGPKAAVLGRLLKSSISVPNGFCITKTAFDNFLSSNGAQPQLTALFSSWESVSVESLESLSNRAHEYIETLLLPPSTFEQIKESYHNLCDLIPSTQAYVVRSSALNEDTLQHSGAGLFDTFLNIQNLSDLIQSIRKCWSSGFTAKALAIRRRHGQPLIPEIAVLVQVMVIPKKSGVLFTADPVSGDRQLLVIESNWGFGTTVVGGKISPDRYFVQRRTRAVDMTIGSKSLQEVLIGHQLVERATPLHERQMPSLTFDEVQNLCDVGITIEQLLQGAQDIEWAFADDLVILQARPITTISSTSSQINERLH